MVYSVKYSIDITKAFLPSKYHLVQRCTRKCKLSESIKESTVFAAQIFA